MRLKQVWSFWKSLANRRQIEHRSRRLFDKQLYLKGFEKRRMAAPYTGGGKGLCGTGATLLVICTSLAVSATSANPAMCQSDLGQRLHEQIRIQNDHLQMRIEMDQRSLLARTRDSGSPGRIDPVFLELLYFTRPLLNGENAVEVKNSYPFPVFVGLRSGKRGKDIKVPAKSRRTFHVADGEYDILFQTPWTLEKGKRFKLAGKGMTFRVDEVVKGSP